MPKANVGSSASSKRNDASALSEAPLEQKALKEILEAQWQSPHVVNAKKPAKYKIKRSTALGDRVVER